jgi:hypothetical protein
MTMTARSSDVFTIDGSLHLISLSRMEETRDNRLVNEHRGRLFTPVVDTPAAPSEDDDDDDDDDAEDYYF